MTDYVIVEFFLYFVSAETDPIGETEEVPGYPKTKNNFIETIETIATFDSILVPLRDSIRWGETELATGYDVPFVDALPNAVTSSIARHKFTFDLDTDKYGVIWWPDNAGPVTFAWLGNTITLDAVASLSVTEDGRTVTGTLYRTNIGLGPLTLESFPA